MIGMVLGNRYEIIEQIGEGGMALVYKAKCNLLNRNVAVKILKKEFIEDENFIKRFNRESQAAASLSHPNILSIYDVGVEKLEDQNIYYIVMEYIEGKTLKDIIREKGKLGLKQTIDFAIQIGKALKHAHSNHVIHRDIKPQNIMITEGSRVKVTDFGIARAATTSTITVTSEAVGSVHYLSPEQARGAYTDEKSDIYSLGIVIYEMITGKLPYEGETPVSIALKHVQEEIVPPSMVENTVPGALETIILKCVKKKQVDRYDSAEKLLEDLQKLKNKDDLNLNAANNSDDSPTRIIPVVKDEDQGENTNKSRKKKRSGRLKPILLGIFLALFLVTFSFFGYGRIKDFFQDSEVIVPDLIGMLEEEAREEVISKGLEFEVEGTTRNNDFEEGEIVQQNVKEGSKVKEGFTIKVIVNEGADLVRVPGLTNKTLGEAEELLGEVGLEIGTIKHEFSDTTPKDMIIRQEPEAHSHLEAGSSVNVVVSEGEETKKIIMPDLRGEGSIEARNIILSLGLQVGQIRQEANTQYEKGIVFRQSYDPGVELETNTVIDLYVSDGPPKEKKPQEPPKEEKPPVKDPPKDEDEDGNNGGDKDNGEGDKDEDKDEDNDD